MNPLAAFALRLEELGPWAPVVFVVLYAAATVAFLPGSLLTLAAGALFGLWRGAALVFVGAVLGSSAAFGLARQLARGRVAARLARDPRAAAIGRAVAGQGLRIVLLLRLSPVFPYNLLNYALGLTEIKYRDYLAGSVGMLPGIFLYAYYGQVVGDVTAVAAGAAPPRGAAYYALLAVGLSATTAVVFVVSRAARRAIDARTD